MFIIFSSHRGPWWTALFIVVMVCASLAKCKYDAEQDALKEATDRENFPAFEQEFNQALGQTAPAISSELLFEFYRCGIRSITEKTYCNRKTDEVLNQLDQQQREALLPLFKESFEPKF